MVCWSNALHDNSPLWAICHLIYIPLPPWERVINVCALPVGTVSNVNSWMFFDFQTFFFHYHHSTNRPDETFYPPCISVHFTYLWKGVSGTIRAAVVLAHVPGCITLQGLLLRGTDCNLCLFHTAFVQRSKKKRYLAVSDSESCPAKKQDRGLSCR